jgi:hypothetical protein
MVTSALRSAILDVFHVVGGQRRIELAEEAS